MRHTHYLLCFLLIITACQPTAITTVDGPVLVQQATVVATNNPLPQLVTPIPSAQIPIRPTSEVMSPLDQVTVDAQFVIVTPTLPPSKTPTPTATQTETPTITPTTTMTNTATSTAFLLPTSEFIAITQPAAANANAICDTNWFFIEPRPNSCPQQPATASNGVFQQFQYGYMIWVGALDAIYVLYQDANQPRWEPYRDFFEETNPTMAYLDADPRELSPGYWSPRRGFGLLWEQNVEVRNRVGSAIQQWEQPYSVQVQTSSDGTIFISTPENFVFALIPNRINWEQYYAFTFDTNRSNNIELGGTIIATTSP